MDARFGWVGLGMISLEAFYSYPFQRVVRVMVCAFCLSGAEWHGTKEHQLREAINCCGFIRSHRAGRRHRRHCWCLLVLLVSIGCSLTVPVGAGTAPLSILPSPAAGP